MNTPTHSKTGPETSCPSRGSADSSHDDTALTIACTLGAGDLRQRVAAIRDLAQRSLRKSERAGLTLHLTFDREALAEVKDMVAKESECCSFLAFDVKYDRSTVHLAITAPESAAEAADQLFAHFAPELAEQAS